MPRKWGPCAKPRCPVLCATTYCDEHRPAAYAGSTRARRLPHGWPALRRLVLRRDAYTCHICGEFGDQVDHVIAGDNHDPDNLAAICRPCHLSKSGHEGGIAQGRYRQ
jgi:5-methylcytosine-specific restriction protein A